MKKIINQAFQGVAVCLVMYACVSIGTIIRYIRMSQNGCIPESLYEFFKMSELWQLVVTCAILMPILMWFIPKLVPEYKPFPAQLEKIFNYTAILLLITMCIFGFGSVFIKNPC